jgi:hypothetical protein
MAEKHPGGSGEPSGPKCDLQIAAGDPPEFVDDEELLRFHRTRIEMDTQTDRSAAILGGAFIDLALEDAIKTLLADKKVKNEGTLFELLFNTANSPLSSFSAKIDLALALELIGPHTYDDLHIIRRIRNEFAHHLNIKDEPGLGLTFNSQSMVARCNNLWIPKNDPYAKSSQKLREKAHLDQPRGQYTFAIFAINGLLHGATELFRARPRLVLSAAPSVLR